MTSHKIVISLLLICSWIFANAQTYQVMDFVCLDKNQNELRNPFAGGMNCPQFNQIDLDLDGVLDLMVFDREGSAITTYLWKNDAYVYAPEYKSIFPRFKKWVRLRDYNADGILDIFCYNIESPLDGVEIYTGSLVDGKYKFDKYKVTEGQYEIIYYLLQGFWYNLEVISSDIPEIIDVDNDGDLDLLTFTGDGGYVRWYKNTCVEDGISLETPTFKLEDFCWGKFYESGFNDNIKLSDDPNKCQEPEFKGNDMEETKSIRHAGSTVTLYDDDADGNYEIIIGDLTNNNLVWMYNGTETEKAFMTEIDTFWPVYDKTVDFYIFNAGFILDVDHDGNDDFVAAPNFESGSANINNAWLYRNSASDGQHDFQFQQEDFLGEDMFDFGSMTAPIICDYNQDGKNDVLIGTYGYFTPSANPDSRLILLENVSEGGELRLELVDDDYLNFSQYSISYYSYAPTLGDMDNDGDDDLIVGTQNGSLLYLENTAGMGNPYTFGPVQFDYMDIDVGENAKPQIIDLNRDGLLDIVIGERTQNAHPEQSTRLGNLNYFQNQGSAENAMFMSDPRIAPNTNVLGNVITKDNTTFNGSAAPHFIDTGDDFLLYVGGENGKVKLYNIGDQDSIYGTFNLIDDEIRAINEGGRVVVATGDLNNDNILEFLVGNVRGGFSTYGSNLGLDGLVGVEDFQSLDVEIYPNPAAQQLTIKSGAEVIINVDIYNLLGQLIWTENSTFIEKSIDVSSWNSGTYNIVIESKSGSKATKTFIKSQP